ncbi:MAG: serine/threonine-protein phosphatase, partial [Planctomycetes bacterium]|nr:serine/threonine-protein phosphatase [Planctomycetota bacterium]
DVCSHGFGPALIMSSTRRALRTAANMNPNAGAILTLVNKAVCEDTLPEHFVTMFLACLEPTTRQLAYAGAGHAAYRLDSDGRVNRLDSTGFPLGLSSDSVYTCAEPLELSPGAVLLLMTDGFQEAFAADGRAFGLSPALEIVREQRDRSAKEIVDALMGAVRHFCQPTGPQDDVTAVVIKSVDR